MRLLMLVGLCLGGATAALAEPPHHAEEVALWPAGSKPLVDGVARIPADDPNAIVTPSFYLYRPRQPARGAVVVFPGGGYKGVAIGKDSTLGLDGADVCAWLTDVGLACIVVRYRVPNTGCHWDERKKAHVSPDLPLALADAQRAIAIVRHNAKRYGINPHNLGVMGFSAGGNLAVLVSTAFAERAYTPIDEIDRQSVRPDFAIPVYPGHMTMEHKNQQPTAIAMTELNSDIQVSTAVPPTLLVHAKDDPVDPVHYSEVYARELKKVGVDVTLLLYETGGHAFGVKRQGKATDRWQSDAILWMKAKKIL